MSSIPPTALSLVALTFASVISAALAQTGNAQQRGIPAHGRIIAETWCSACHLVSPSQTHANADVPTFASIARRLPGDADLLAAFIANPHPPMPNLNLSRQDIQDLLAYIATLK
jgi:mono/diheme cytochrome c family protein